MRVRPSDVGFGRRVYDHNNVAINVKFKFKPKVLKSRVPSPNTFMGCRKDLPGFIFWIFIFLLYAFILQAYIDSNEDKFSYKML